MFSSDNPFDVRRRVQQESEPNVEFLQRRINHLGLPRSSDYSNDGSSYNSQMLGERQVAEENISQKVDQQTSIVTSGAHLEQEKPTHTETDVHQRRPNYSCDFGPLLKVAPKNANRFPPKLPHHTSRSATYFYQNIDESMQKWHYRQNPGSRHTRPQQLSYTSRRTRPLKNQNSQLRRIRGRDMNTIKRIAHMRPASVHRQLKDRYGHRFDTLGRDINAISNASLLDENCFRPTAPLTSTCQYRFKSKPREQILQKDQIHAREPSEPSQESNSDPLLRDLLDFLTQNKEVPQKGPTGHIHSITKNNGLNLKEGSSSDHNDSGFISHPDVQKSNENLITTHACLQNQERYSPDSESVTSPGDENATRHMDREGSNIRIKAVISLPLLYSRLKLNPPLTNNYSSEKTQTEENEEFAQFISHDNNNLPIDSWNIKEETGEYQLEEPNRSTNITAQFSKKEISQQQDGGEPQNISDENSSISETIIEDEIVIDEKKINLVDESQNENVTKSVKESSGVIEDLTSTEGVGTKLKDAEYKSEINRSKLDMLIEFLKEGKRGSDDGEENESLKTKSKKGKSSAKANRKKAENANKTKHPEGNREDRNQEKIMSKTADEKERFPVKRYKSCVTNEWQPNADLNSEEFSEEENSMRWVRDSQERSKFDETDFPRPGPSTADPPERHITIYFNSEYKFCEYCLMARSKSDFWMNIATEQLICLFCLNGTSRYAESQRVGSKAPEKKKRRGTAGSVSPGKNFFDNLSTREKTSKESSESKTCHIKDSVERENIKTKKVKSLDEDILREVGKKNKSCKRSELSDKVTLPNIKAVKRGRPRKNSTNKIRKLKDDDPPYVPKHASLVKKDISDNIKKQILEKVYFTGKYKKSMNT